MADEAGAVIGVLFSIVFIAAVYWLYLRFAASRKVEEEESYNEVKTVQDKTVQDKTVTFNESANFRYDDKLDKLDTKDNTVRRTKPRISDDISLLLFPEVINPMVDVEAGYSNGDKDEEDDQSESLENVSIEGICKSGYLRKKSTSMRKDWLVRWFFITDGKLFYVHRHTELVGRKNVNARQVANLMISTVKEVGDVEFQIISPGQRGRGVSGGVYELQGDTVEEVHNWVIIIRQQIEGALIENLPTSPILEMSESASTLFMPSPKTISELRTVNPYCADCGAAAPEWASLNLCIMVCIDCSGVHRKLGTHISKVRSITLDKWTFNAIQLLLTIGNERSNAVWEASLENAEEEGLDDKPTAVSSMEERERFIVRKYVQRDFVFARDATIEQKEIHLIKSAADGDLIGIMAAIAAGADINVRTGADAHGVDGRTPLHLVSMGRHILCVEILCQLNANINVRDSSGASPMDVAEENGFTDVSEMLIAAAGGNSSKHGAAIATI